MDVPLAYQVIQDIEHHRSDVKAVLSLEGGTRLACTSRDGTVSLWSRQPDVDSFVHEADFQGHDAYVNSVAHVAPDEDGKRGYLASGGNSTMILLHSLDSLSPQIAFCLIGHTHNVCALHYSPSRKLLGSSSWDTTARIWARSGDDWVTRHVLEGHRAAVWDVKILDDAAWQANCVTASADGEIWTWSQEGEAVRRIKCCPEPVRSLAILPGGEMASASNDAVIRVWDAQGKTIASLTGHKDYIYQVVASAKGMVSCGEDHTARVWDDSGTQVDVLKHPCTSVWSVTAFADGLIATGGSDGVVRVWRQVPTSSTEKTAAAIADDGSANSGEEAIETSGASGEQPLDEGDKGAANKAVIDIDIADDQPPLQLVIQQDDDPAELARRFGQEHGLSENYISRIEEFVRNTLPQLGGGRGS